jgi:hypothetical protein
MGVSAGCRGQNRPLPRAAARFVLRSFFGKKHQNHFVMAAYGGSSALW